MLICLKRDQCGARGGTSLHRNQLPSGSGYSLSLFTKDCVSSTRTAEDVWPDQSGAVLYQRAIMEQSPLSRPEQTFNQNYLVGEALGCKTAELPCPKGLPAPVAPQPCYSTAVRSYN